jgi:cysteine desulfurase
MMVNHETGALQPLSDAGRACRPVLLHCDAAQAVGKIPHAGFHELGVTSLSVSGHKFGGPKGIGLLLLKRGIILLPRQFGGHQQQGRRPGTESVALAVGLAKSLEIAAARREQSLLHVGKLHRHFLTRLRDGASPIGVNSSFTGSPYVANLSFPGCRADLLLMKLDLMGVACSTGSACSSGSLLPSPVLQAMGVTDELLQSAMRFSFSSGMSLAEIEEAANRIIKAVNDLRSDDSDEFS